ncbi:unnamed protein product [Auanema sp. JU1783]|nr:unnamed protein product [Auanema sp. JU1783]
MTCMVNYTAVKQEQMNQVSLRFDNETEINNGTQNLSDKRIVDYGGTFVWDGATQNWLMSAVYWGGPVSMLPAIFLVQRASPKHMFAFCLAVKASVNLLIPTLAKNFGARAVFAARFAIGLTEPFIYPSVNTIASNWYPAVERSTAVALFTTGNQLAMFTGNPINASLCSSPFGWSAVFYFSAIMGYSWCILWLIFSANHPDDCKVMSNLERSYLSDTTVAKITALSKRNVPVPWKAIFTNPAYLSHLFATYVISVIAPLMMTYLPMYNKDVLLLSVVMNGLYAALPTFFNFCFKLFWGFTVDRLKQTGVLTPTQGVKLSQCYPTFGVAIPLFTAVLFVNSDRKILALILFCFANMFLGAHTSGAYTSLLSLAPRFTPTLSSISCSLSTLSAITTPIVVGELLKTGSPSEWNSVLLVCAVLCTISGIQFLIYGSGDIQEFAKETLPKDQEVNEQLVMDEIRASSIALRTESMTLA